MHGILLIFPFILLNFYSLVLALTFIRLFLCRPLSRSKLTKPGYNQSSVSISHLGSRLGTKNTKNAGVRGLSTGAFYFCRLCTWYSFFLLLLLLFSRRNMLYSFDSVRKAYLRENSTDLSMSKDR